jgi:hypothetical protein
VVAMTAAARREKQIKYFRRVFRYAYGSRSNTEKLINAIKQRSLLRVRFIDELADEGRKVKAGHQAHHVIPIECAKQIPLVQKAILNGFDINSLDNGVLLSLAAHKRRHKQMDDYNKMVMTMLLSKQAELGERFSKEDAHREVQFILMKLRAFWDD